MEKQGKKTYVLDTCVLMHDPERAFTAFQEHDVVIPIIVFAELDGLQKDPLKGEKAKAVIRRFVELMDGNDPVKGISTPGGGTIRVDADGNFTSDLLPTGFDIKKPDNLIIMTAKALMRYNSNTQVILVTKDICLRIIAQSVGVRAEDYLTGRVVEKTSVNRSTLDLTVPDEVISLICQQAHKNGLCISESGIPDETLSTLHPNACLCLTGRDNARTALTIFDKTNSCLRKISKPSSSNDKKSGVCPRNEEQAFAYELACSQNINIVTLAGKAGTGKSLMALLAAWRILNGQTSKGFENRIMESDPSHNSVNLIVFRPTREVGPEMGFLPGTIEEKFAPWAQPVINNLRLIASGENNGEYQLEEFVKASRIQILPITHIRGATFNNAIIIADDAQNYDPDEIKTLVTRAGEGSRMIITGDSSQVDVRYLDAYSNGFSHLINRFTGRDIYGHVSLFKGERSRLAELAAEIL